MVFNRDQRIQSALTHHFTVGHDADAITDLLELLEKMGGDEYGDATLFELEDQVPDLPRARGIHACGGFVENEEARLVNERLGEADALEHAFRITAYPTTGGTFQTREREEIMRPLL